MVASAYGGKVSVGGTSTAFTTEACTLVSGNIYQITDSAKRAWNPAVAVSVYDGGVLQAASAYSLNYLYGKITFVAPPGGAVTVSGEYFPLWEVTTVKGYKLALSCALLDSSVMSQTQTHRVRTASLYDVTASLSLYEQGNTDYDTGGGTKSMDSILTGAAVIFVQCKLGNISNTWSAMLFATDGEVSGAFDGLVENTMNFALSAGVLGSSFKFSFE